MTGLVIKLGPKERIMINGAVLENGDKRTRINILSPNANVLRLRDAIHPSKAVTPVGRLCYALQLVLAGDTGPEEAQKKAMLRIEELSRVFTDHDSRSLLGQATEALSEQNFYKCLKAIRGLLPREARLLAMSEL